jgi:hypothetical protein
MDLELMDIGFALLCILLVYISSKILRSHDRYFGHDKFKMK